MAHDILIVDDESDIRTLVSGILEDEGYLPREAADGAEALAGIETRRPSLVLLDIWLQGSKLDGIGILEIIKNNHPDLPVVMMSGHGTIETAVKAINLGAYDFIEKPFKSDRLIMIITRAVETARLKRENEELRRRAGAEAELIGRSPAINQVRQTIARVAPANSRVLITGPAGSGKEVVARMLHGSSHRADGPFVVVNCANMLPERMEIELFGTEDADGKNVSRKVGTFESAHNGTLYLDEVTDMPLETQAKIVRVLQDQIFKRVGGSTLVKVDVRVVASVTGEIKDEIAAGRFREDLFYRLSVVPIEVPPLKDRPDDIPLLAKFFMERAAESGGRQPRDIGKDALAVLQTYEWPGNVRELRNVVERLLIMAPGHAGEPIGAEALAVIIGNSRQPENRLMDTSKIMNLSFREARGIFEKEYLHSQVTRFGGNISRTADFIGMERSALHRKLKSLGINSDDKNRPNGAGKLPSKERSVQDKGLAP
ncbi:MAG: sigma-54-dependent Fis family transcriptional regulator [Rhodospirillales bacterium RIFCSPLOWO2_12_FULL_58_28]|nr:MAG: sigma-54-dependent Fis family transcriptional regulator [Rhodospirillales bacterium RIFCSPLOWO2_02_FULL_58_16]OHC78819.1 MAG: sigma-54-dependent Fis family transcriptional regulator [Rhodospirillales bacterium RIFCSPLOWO2_12_FULL_58_28]